MADPREIWSAEELELRTQGRRTGHTHAVLVWFAHEDGVLWLRTDETMPDWLLNLRAHPRAIARIADREVAVRYEPVDDRDGALRHLVSLWRAKYGPEWVQDWYVEKGREPVKLRIEGGAPA
jgi:hypothetical protein